MLAATHVPRSGWLATLLLAALISVGLLTQLNSLLSSLTFSIVLPLRGLVAGQNLRGYSACGLDVSDTAAVVGPEPPVDERGDAGAGDGVRAPVVAVKRDGGAADAGAGRSIWRRCLRCWCSPASGFCCLGRRNATREIHQSGLEVSLRSRSVFESSVERLQNLKVGEGVRRAGCGAAAVYAAI